MSAVPAGGGTTIDEGWHPARLIPVGGIKGQEEQERRATSSLLAVMGAVPEFGHALLGPLGAPRGRIRTFAEVQLRDGDGRVSIPDGAVVVERGRRQWRALVEVKTGRAQLATEQVGRYLDLARDHGFDSVVTISNHITAGPEDSPVAVDRRKTRRVRLYHLSWWRIVTEAVLQHRFRGIADPDQAWILGELIAYLDHESSGAGGFDDMGERWVRVRDGARQGTLRMGDREVRVVAERWDHFLDYLALSLAQDLGRDVLVVRPRKQTSADRTDGAVQQLAVTATLNGSLRVPNTVAALEIRADLRARQITTTVRIDAPNEGRASSRVNWLLRQLRDAAPDLRIEAAFPNVRETTSLLLSEAVAFPQRLLFQSDPRRAPRAFAVAMVRPMGLKRGKGAGSFVRETRRQVLDFYGSVVQGLKPWQAKPPQLRPPELENWESDAATEPPAGVQEPMPADALEETESALPATASFLPQARLLALPRGKQPDNDLA